MRALEEIKARAGELRRTRTRDLASNLIEYGAEYLLFANVEADHRRLVAALEAVEAITEHVSQSAVDAFRNAEDMPAWFKDATKAHAAELKVIAADLHQAITEALQ